MKQETPTPTKKPRGQAPRPVVQIDPTTLQPVKEWPTMGDAADAVGSLRSNIHRAATQLRTAAGFYWTDPDGVADFKDRLTRKKSTPRSQRDSSFCFITIPPSVFGCFCHRQDSTGIIESQEKFIENQ